MTATAPQPAPNATVEGYDRAAERYGHHWAPVLDDRARALLARVERDVRLPPTPTILDVGTGHGVLALEALRRWPGSRVIAADASAGMLAVARRIAADTQAADPSRLRWLHAPADRLELPDQSVDLVVSSFVYQLVPDRAAALAEALRVLRPLGHIALVSWLDRGEDYRPAVEFDEAVYDLNIEEPEPPPDDPARAGDFRSPRAATRELRAAGFERVSARADMLTWTWTVEGYLEFKRRYDEDDLFELLDAEKAEALIERARARIAALPPEAMTWRAEIVSAVARRPR